MAERELTAAVLAAIIEKTVRPALFFEMTYSSGGADAYLRLFTGYGQIVWNGSTWTGGRDKLSITPIQEKATVEAIGFAVRMSGLPADKLGIALQSMKKNRPGKLWLGFFDDDYSLIADPYPLRRGRFDMAPIQRTGETMTIEVQYEDRLVLLDKPGGPNGERRYTPEDQALRLAGDRGFDMVAQLQDMQGKWGTSQA
jgi:hypothetical protein